MLGLVHIRLPPDLKASWTRWFLGLEEPTRTSTSMTSRRGRSGLQEEEGEMGDGRGKLSRRKQVPLAIPFPRPGPTPTPTPTPRPKGAATPMSVCDHGDATATAASSCDESSNGTERICRTATSISTAAAATPLPSPTLALPTSGCEVSKTASISPVATLSLSSWSVHGAGGSDDGGGDVVSPVLSLVASLFFLAAIVLLTRSAGKRCESLWSDHHSRAGVLRLRGEGDGEVEAGREEWEHDGIQEWYECSAGTRVRCRERVDPSGAVGSRREGDYDVVSEGIACEEEDEVGIARHKRTRRRVVAVSLVEKAEHHALQQYSNFVGNEQHTSQSLWILLAPWESITVVENDDGSELSCSKSVEAELDPEYPPSRSEIVASFDPVDYSALLSCSSSSLDSHCPICLESFLISDTVVRLPCSALRGHTFHVDCIDEWICTTARCPVCRRRFGWSISYDSIGTVTSSTE